MIFVFAVGSVNGHQVDGRLDKLISMRQEIIALADLGREMTSQTGVPMSVSRRIQDRKVTIVFRDRPVREVMARLATGLGMEWKPAKGNGYELDLTPLSARNESQTDSFERSKMRQGLRDAVREIVALSTMSVQERNSEREKLDASVVEASKAGQSSQSKFQLVRNKAASLHYPGFLELVGPALSKAPLDRDGVPSGVRWFASADPSDAVGLINLPAFPAGRRTSYSDLIGFVSYTEGSRELQTKLFAFDENGGGPSAFSVGTWPIHLSSSDQPSPLELAMSQWSKTPSRQLLERPVQDPPEVPERSDYVSGMFGRARHLLNFSDRSGLPIVADASRRAITPPRYLRGKTVGEWIENYSKANKVPFQGQPDYVREEQGWLLFREDHWWWHLKSEIPEATLRPLEAKVNKGIPLALDDYATFAAGLDQHQLAGLKQPESVLLKFPVGNLYSCSSALVLYGLLDSDGRARATSRRGIELASQGDRVEELALECLTSIAIDGMDVALLRTILRQGRQALEGFRLFCEGLGSEKPEELRVDFVFGPSPNSSQKHTFATSRLQTHFPAASEAEDYRARTQSSLAKAARQQSGLRRRQS